MVNIRIADHVQYASSYQDGQVIYDLIVPALLAGDTVDVSFDGITAVPSAFVNAALLQLLEVMPMSVIRDRLRISGSTRYINGLIKRRFDYVTSQPQPGPMPSFLQAAA
jgi:hypothetical protein